MNRQPDAMLEHRIQQRAYEIHQNKASSSPLEDWLEAEREVLREVSYCHDRFIQEAIQQSKQAH
jgi:hypothetical protein